MPLLLDEDIAGVLRRTKTIALEIASLKPHRDSNKIFRFLIASGYEMYPVNPRHAGGEIAGRKIYSSLADIPCVIDLVDIFRRSDSVEPIVTNAIAVEAKAVWMQLGVINTRAVELAERAGLQVVMDRCPAIEIPRLQATGIL